MAKPLRLIALALLTLISPAVAAPWREEPAVAALFRQAGVEGTFVLLEERSGDLRGSNRQRAEQRFVPASTFKIANALIGLSVGAVSSVDEVIPYTGDANPFMREWLEPMGLRGAMKVSNVPLYQELARRIGLQRMGEAVVQLGYGNQQIGSDVSSFWLRGPLAISAVEQTGFLSRLAHRTLPFPDGAQRQVADITLVDSGPGWSLHAKTGWQNAPGAGVGWWVGWVHRASGSHPLRSIWRCRAPPMPPGASSWAAPACRPWESCRRPPWGQPPWGQPRRREAAFGARAEQRSAPGRWRQLPRFGSPVRAIRCSEPWW